MYAYDMNLYYTQGKYVSMSECGWFASVSVCAWPSIGVTVMCYDDAIPITNKLKEY